jgi:hypothetical protein
MNARYEQFAHLRIGMVIDFHRADGQLQRGEIIEVHLLYPAYIVVKFEFYRNGRLVKALKAIWPGDAFQVVQDAAVPEASRDQAVIENDPGRLEGSELEFNESSEHETTFVIPEVGALPEANNVGNERTDQETGHETCQNTNEVNGKRFSAVVMLMGLLIGLSFGAIIMFQTQGIFGYICFNFFNSYLPFLPHRQ